MIPAIEPWPWSQWPVDWGRRTYFGWADLEAIIKELVAGRRIAMEYSPGNAIPYLDRVAAGAVEMVRNAGADVVSSADLVTHFFALWTPEQFESHHRTAETLASLAHEAMELAGRRARTPAPIAEHELRDWIIERLADASLVSDALPMVAAGAHSADVHYAPAAERPRPIRVGDVLLIDVWAREPDGVFADQTWMATVGPVAPRVGQAWDAAIAARDGALAMIADRVARGDAVRGSEVHQTARAILEERGFGEYAVGRAGHSIGARQLHGSGPNLDCLETRDQRTLIPGCACSVEPGVYLPGEFGIRSEVNVLLGERTVVVTPRDFQKVLLEL